MTKVSLANRRHERKEAKRIPAKPGKYSVRPHKNPLDLDLTLSGKFNSRAEARKFFTKEVGAGRYRWEERP